MPNTQLPVVSKFMRAILAIMGFIGVSRGLDYVTGNSNSMGRWIDDDLTMPEVWGAACLIAGVLVITAALVPNPRLAMNSALIGFAVSFTLAFQIWDNRMWVVPWPPEDVRMATDHLGHALVFLTIAVTIFYRESKRRRVKEIVAKRENERRERE